jgi:hypothetical protein
MAQVSLYLRINQNGTASCAGASRSLKCGDKLFCTFSIPPATRLSWPLGFPHHPVFRDNPDLHTRGQDVSRQNPTARLQRIGIRFHVMSIKQTPVAGSMTQHPNGRGRVCIRYRLKRTGCGEELTEREKRFRQSNASALLHK